VANRFYRAERREKATAIRATELIEFDAFAAMHEAGSDVVDGARARRRIAVR
jgi:hypothetical protein